MTNHAHFLTFSCYGRRKLLRDPEVKDKLLELWETARLRMDFALFGYVVMPEHAHVLIHPRNESYEMSRLLRGLKEPFTRWVCDHWKNVAPERLREIEVRHGARTYRRFWQAGGGYDRNVYTLEALNKAIAYIEWNPVAAKLVSEPADWRWSSAWARVNSENALLRVDGLSCLERESVSE